MAKRDQEATEEFRAKARKKYDGDLYATAVDLLGYAALYEPLHRRISEFLTTWIPGKYIKLLLVAREHCKSTLGSISFPIHTLAKNPGARFLLAHGKFSFGKDYLREAKEKMKRKELQFVYPDSFWSNPSRQAPIWQADKIVLPGSDARTPSFSVTSPESEGVGFHFDYIIGDDLVDKANASTKELRDKIKSYFHSLVPTLLPGGKILLIGTFYSHDDLYSYLLDTQNPYHAYVDAFIQDCGYPNEPVFPRLPGAKLGFTLEDLEMRKGGMDPYQWSCQYMLNPMPIETQHFRRSDILPFEFWPGEKLPIDEETEVVYYTAVDPNRSEKTTHDHAVILTVAVDSNGHYWVVDMTRGHPSGPQLVDWIRGHAVKWNPKRVLIEANNFQLQLGSWLKEDMVKTGFAYPIDMLNRGPTQRKMERISRMEVMVRQQRLHVRYGLEQLTNELEFFPRYKCDDIVDALADVFQYASVPDKPEKNTRGAPRSGFLLSTMVDDMLEEQGRVGVYRSGNSSVRRV